MNGVWTGPVASALRADLNAGGSKFCGDCPLKLPLKKDEAAPVALARRRRAPSRLYIECTAACNISCYKACCAPETGITKTRQAGMLDFDLFKRVVDEAGPTLGRIDFFNYGEAFLHKRAEEMCEYIKAKLSAHLPLHEHERRGADARARATAGAIRHRRSDVLDRRRQPGDLRAIPSARQLREGDREPPRHGRREGRAGPDVPFLNWRYILFTWNDRDEEMERARKIATEIGVDRLSWELTDHPEDAYLATLRAGARRISIASGARCGTTTGWATPSAAPHPRPASTSGRRCPACRSSPGRAGR